MQTTARDIKNRVDDLIDGISGEYPDIDDRLDAEDLIDAIRKDALASVGGGHPEASEIARQASRLDEVDIDHLP